MLHLNAKIKSFYALTIRAVVQDTIHNTEIHEKTYILK